MKPLLVNRTIDDNVVQVCDIPTNTASAEQNELSAHAKTKSENEP